MARLRLRLMIGLAIAIGMAPRAGVGEIYTWTDASGHTHYTQDLQSVPADQRAAAREGAAQSAGSNKVQTFTNAPAARSPAPARSAAPNAPRVHRIPVERAGNGMIVPVRINGRVVAPFLIDTGASYVLVPKAVADEAGLHGGPDTRKMQFSTANGVVEQAIVTLDSVELGTAHAENVPASISPTLQVGLLGLSFFNRFTYQVDAANGVLTLVENDLAANGDLRGGRSETQWRNEYDGVRQRKAALDARRATTPDSHTRLVSALDEQQAALDRELELLDSEADQANVPDSWRR